MTAKNEKITLTTPVGRIVQGDIFTPQTKDSEGRLLTIKSGPNAGQPATRFFVALAIAKNDPGWPALQQAIHSTAQSAFPTLFNPQGQCLNPQFAFKITDGDSDVPNTKGTKPSSREGFPGHWIVSFTNGFQPKCYTTGGASIITDQNSVKRGDYVRIFAEIKGNESLQQPGMFLNHGMIEFIGHGEPIISGPSGSDVFGAAPAQMPTGVSATPLAPATTMAAPPPTAAPPLATPAGLNPGSGAPAIPPTPPPVGMASVATGAPTNVKPAHDFLNPPTPQAPPPPTPQVPATPQMTAAANGVTYEQYKSGGWTDEQMKASGLIA